MIIISASYGNDSMALIQWAHENGFNDVIVVYCDTGWSAPTWGKRVETGEALARGYGFKTKRLKSTGMRNLVLLKKGWPGNAQQFCTAHLKGLPFLDWIEDADPERQATILIGKRRAESRARANTPEYVESSGYHGERKLWHPLYAHTDQERNELLERAGVGVLPWRSQECSPCVNANREDILLLTASQIEAVSELEVAVGKPMFRPKRFGAMGIYGVVAWAKYGRKRGLFDIEGCGSPFGCRI